MNLKALVALLIGFGAGAAITYLEMREPRGLQANPFASPPPEAEETSPLPSEPTREEERLSALSGKWVSPDGQQSAELDGRILRFHETVDWPDLDRRHFLFSGGATSFMTNSGYYNLHTNPDKLLFLKEDLKTGDYTSFCLYREGSPDARSRTPLAEKAAPPKVAALLAAIPTITVGERKDAVMKRFGLADDESLELLDAESSMGQTDMLLSLGIDNEWMLKLQYKVDRPDADAGEAVIRHFQAVRGYVDDVKAGRFDIMKPVFPYYSDGTIVLAPSTADEGATTRPAREGGGR